MYNVNCNQGDERCINRVLCVYFYDLAFQIFLKFEKKPTLKAKTLNQCSVL